MLVFLYNELLDRELRDAMCLDGTFVSFAYIEDVKMYQLDIENVTVVKYDDVTQGYGNNKVYGAIYMLNDREYLRYINAYMLCSNSVLGGNHKYDTNHLYKMEATVISFDTLDQLARLRYNIISKVEVFTYLGNIEKEEVTNRVRQSRYRIASGMLEDSFFNEWLKEG